MMNKWLLKRIFGIGFLCVLFSMSACEKQKTPENGILEGVITIGPLCPVERPFDPACQPTAETYKAYPVSVWTSDGTQKITLLNPALNGSYKTELAPGTYLVLLEREQNGAGGSNLPVGVLISPSLITKLNINIDTGIR